MRSFFRYIKDCSQSSSPTQKQCRDLYHNIINKDIVQSIYNWGLGVVECALDYFEQQEVYDICSDIKQDIKEYKKVTDDRIGK